MFETIYNRIRWLCTEYVHREPVKSSRDGIEFILPGKKKKTGSVVSEHVEKEDGWYSQEDGREKENCISQRETNTQVGAAYSWRKLLEGPNTTHRHCTRDRGREQYVKSMIYDIGCESSVPWRNRPRGSAFLSFVFVLWLCFDLDSSVGPSSLHGLRLRFLPLATGLYVMYI